MPELRIVPQDTWDAVKQRQKKQAERSAKIKVALHTNARTGAGPKYLLSGFLKCSVCGANYVMADRYRYACAKNKDRGETVCSNNLRVPRKLVEDKLLSTVKSDLFCQEGFDVFKAEIEKLSKSYRKQTPSDQALLEKNLKQVEQEIENIIAAIKMGILSESTKSELEKSEKQKMAIKSQLDFANGAETGFDFKKILPNLEKVYTDAIERLEEYSLKEIGSFRHHLSGLIGQDIMLKPKDGYLEAQLQGDYVGLFQLLDKKSKLSLVV